MTYRPFRLAATLAVVCAAATTHAAFVDEAVVRRDGADAVVELIFGAEIQFQRTIRTRTNDFLVVSYTLLATTDQDVRVPQALRLGAAQGLPDIRITDEVEQGERRRRLVVRFARPVTAVVRAGAGNRSIEIVLKGLGSAVRDAVPDARSSPANLPPAERRFVIVLAQGEDPDVRLPRAVPASLQDYAITTQRRVVDGVARHEVQVGWFATRAQAEAVLQQLSGFPQAVVVALEPEVPAVDSVPVASAAAPVAVAPVAAAPVAAAPAEAAPPSPAEVESRAAALLAQARGSYDQGNTLAALESLSALLDLPPNRSTPEAQELAGLVRLRAGDPQRARIEFETYLRLYPDGAAAARVRTQLAALPAPAPVPSADGKARPLRETTVNGSVSMYYYGGNGRVRSRDFQDSPVSGVPQVAGDELLSSDRSSQLYNDVDLNWRRRDDEQDLRFVFRDAYTTDLDRPEKTRNRLSALYLDYKSIPHGFGLRVGRQSPTGGGVMGRFDGVQAHLNLAPKVKLGAVAGMPADRYFESRRRFAGASLDAEAIVPNVGGAVYAIEQRIDGQIDRRAVGLEARYFKGGVSAFGQLDYDLPMKTTNIAAIQGTWILEDNSVVNALLDRRALQMVALGNALTFTDPSGILFTRIADKLATTTLEALRDQVRRTTPFVRQAQLGVTRPVTPKWQVGGSVQLTNVGAIPPVPDVPGFENGRAATGNLWSATAQLIGLNLYSPRDTHVLSLTLLSTPAVKNIDGYLVSYNNSSVVWESWQLEPSIQYYRDRGAAGATNERWTPGLRLTYRGFARWALEAATTYEIGRATRQAPDPNDPTLTIVTRENSTRVNYSLGARFEF